MPMVKPASHATGKRDIHFSHNTDTLEDILLSLSYSKSALDCIFERANDFREIEETEIITLVCCFLN